ncbi:immunity protein Tsi6 family protein [Rhodanobacter thiooxydans]|uniref:immunity protein Tsi6 family protein n=1 Tax=Rhodanobacter thiooxydans TaxID=416169 RepID=UPI00137A04DE|nr:immunity protein Tsi6 family protein [Rhodanobacter thiooxydans]MCW0201315.1 immunity protein Tsi6 family protein [Rhodanobacter thiooxydans]
MIDRDEAVCSVRKALTLLTARMPENQGYGVYIHGNEQLTRMLVELGHPYLPAAPEREWVDIGFMAAKELDAMDPEFANALTDADQDFKHARCEVCRPWPGALKTETCKNRCPNGLLLTTGPVISTVRHSPDRATPDPAP